MTSLPSPATSGVRARADAMPKLSGRVPAVVILFVLDLFGYRTIKFS